MKNRLKLIMALVLGLICLSVIVVGLKQRNHSPRVPCYILLKQIDGEKSIWEVENKKRDGDIVTWDDLFGPTKSIREKPVCPQGGVYTIGKVGELPRCSIPGHTIGP